MKRPPGNEMLSRARRLRRDMTPAERHLWSYLRSDRQGVKFRRQMWLAGFIADFACVEARLVIEVDGGQHGKAQEKDRRRAAAMCKAGYRTLRFWNNDVFDNLDGVLKVIQEAIEKAIPSPSHPASPAGPLPLPKMGEGFPTAGRGS